MLWLNLKLCPDFTGILMDYSQYQFYTFVTVKKKDLLIVRENINNPIHYKSEKYIFWDITVKKECDNELCVQWSPLV